MNRIDIMKQAARSAGSFILGAAQPSLRTEKANANDFVTVADIKSQDVLREELAKHFPDAVILSEEDSDERRAVLYEPNFTGFVLDPIDGTYNFTRGMRESAISIGYVENGKPVAGVVYDPYKDELFEAEEGMGAFCNGQLFHISSQSDLRGASVATSNGYDYAAAVRNLQRQIAIHEHTGVMPWTSCPGSAVLTMVWVACGRVDALHHTGFKPWDNAAAILIVREAGGRVLRLQDGEEAKFTDNALLLGTPTIVEALQNIFQKLPRELMQ